MDNKKLIKKIKSTVFYKKVIVKIVHFSELLTDEDISQFSKKGEHFFLNSIENFEILPQFKNSEDQLEQLIKKEKIEDSSFYKLFKSSPRQQELIKLLSEGNSFKECSEVMNVSLQEIYQKVARLKKKIKENGKSKI